MYLVDLFYIASGWINELAKIYCLPKQRFTAFLKYGPPEPDSSENNLAH